MANSKDFNRNFTLKEITNTSQQESKDLGEEVPGSSATFIVPSDSKLVSVEYPGIISSVDMMLETVGGEKAVSKTYSDPNRRLELCFRPRDPFCHCLCGNRFTATSFLLKVRKRVRKGKPDDVRINMELQGVIGTTYKFQGMADFQYLAVHSDRGKQTSLYNTILLRKPENQEYFEQDVPHFLPPAIFSRVDNPVDYCYRPDTHHNRLGFSQPVFSRENLIGLNRARRPHNAIFISFDDGEVPLEPVEAARANWDRICQNPSDRKAEEDLKKLFEKRPIWSRNAVKANLDIHPEKLKQLLPVLAYYMVTGPWRSLWVRLGYDPRKIPEAKKYQVLDFRIRCSSKHGYSVNEIPVKPKRSTLNYTLPNTFNKAVPQPVNVMELSQKPSSSRLPQYQLQESSYIFQEGTLPPYRQMFYQLCDLNVEKIRKVIQRNDGKEETCDERDGWCVPRTTDDLRNIMSSLIKQAVRDQRPVAKGPQRPKRSVAQRRATESDDEEEEDGDEEEEYHPSEGSDNEMVTEMLDYM
ncbi:general transcription factor 3C polypeptide 5 isoform X1 [Osmerus eperlanus]|uniref:general transcription factor 3C polypeptide 5 isoform X1 n=1 Tax=Osmerus eperlanus TaxID=29151 RepID=UPI002E12F3C2